MFHSSGYFKKTLCPFHEHGLCHRPHCHYSHKLPKPPAPAKKPSYLKKTPGSTSASTPAPTPASLLNIDLSKIDDKVMSDVAMAIDQVSNFFGSSSGRTTTSQPEREPPQDPAVPSYAPEKCMEVSSTPYPLPRPPASVEPHSPDISSKPSATPSPKEPDSLLDSPVARQPSADADPPMTEEDIFGSPVDDLEGDVADIEERGVVDNQEGGVAEGSNPAAVGTEDLSKMELEFNKVTSLPAVGGSQDPPSLKRKAQDDLYGTMVRKKWKAHSNTQIMREAARVAPKPTTVNSNFSAMLSGTSLYMGKERKAIAKDPKASAGRPKLPLTVNARIPTSLRQKFLDAFIDEHLKMTSDPQQAYTTSLEEERALFEKSSKRMLYMNHSTSALKKLREKAKACLAEQEAKSNARVKVHEQQPKSKSELAMKKGVVSITKIKKEALSSKCVDPPKKKDWREFEGELQDTFFSDEVKSLSKQFNSRPPSKKAKARVTSSTSVEESNPKCLKFYGHSDKMNKANKADKMDKLGSDKMNKADKLDKVDNADRSVRAGKVSVTEKPSLLEADLFGESTSEDDADVTTPLRSEVIEISDDHDPDVSFESALVSVDSRKATKRKRKKKKLAKKVKLSRPQLTKDEKVKGHEEPPVNVSSASDDNVQPVRRNSSNQLSRVPMLSLVRSVRLSSSDSERSSHIPSTGGMELTPCEDLPDWITDPQTDVLANTDPQTDANTDPQTSDSVFAEIQPQEQVCLTTTKSSSRPLLSPTFAPSGPFINLTKLATTRKKAPQDVASIVRSMGQRPAGGERSKPSTKPSITIIKRKEIPLTSSVFYQYMCQYVLSEEQLETNGYPCQSEKVGVATINRGDATPPVIEAMGESGKRHVCCRCNKPFVIYNDGKYQSLEECFYHYGRLVKSREYGEGVVSIYTCCQGRRDSDGCQYAKLHVTSGELPSREAGYVTTMSGLPGNQCVYAVDCEMCYTTAGLQLTRVSVIDWTLCVVMESLVKPSHPIVDYNTRFSGLKAEDFVSVRTTLSDVQEQLLSLVGPDTILLGHSLESDLRALKVVHDLVVDTALVFPHKKGLPYKRSLKALMTEYLQKFIQNDIDGGHDSLEDSRACMELMIWKVKGDLKKDSRRASDSK